MADVYLYTSDGHILLSASWLELQYHPSYLHRNRFYKTLCFVLPDSLQTQISTVRSAADKTVNFIYHVPLHPLPSGKR